MHFGADFPGLDNNDPSLSEGTTYRLSVLCMEDGLCGGRRPFISSAFYRHNAVHLDRVVLDEMIPCRRGSDRIAVEKNYGGDMARAGIQAAMPAAPVQMVSGQP